MKIINFLFALLLIMILNTNIFAANSKDCKSIKADTGVKLYEKIKCKIDEEKGVSLTNKFKNIIKKKN